MNARLPLLTAALVSLLLSSPASAADLTLTYAPTSDSDTGAKTIGDITITPTYTWDVAPFFKYTSSSGLQMGKARTNLVSVAYSFSAFPSEIKSIAVTGKSSSKNKGNVSVSATIGSVSFSGTDSWTDKEGTITLTAPEGTQTGNLSVSISNPNGENSSNNKDSQAIYLKSIVVTYKDPAAADFTQLDTPTNLSAPSTNYFGFALSWNPVTDATNGYRVTLSPVAGNSGVTVSGRTATMTGLAEGTPYTASVVAIGDGTGTDDSEAATLSVTTLTAPPVTAPDVEETAVSSSSFTVSWSVQPAADHFSVRAWTLVPADVAAEYFAGYAADGTPPEGWNFQNKGTPYSDQAENPVDFRDDGDWIGSPVFGGIVTNVSFRLRRQNENGSTFTVYGSTGSDDESEWKTAENTLAVLTGLQTQVYDIPIDVSKGIKRIFFQYTKSSGNVSIGTFSVKGTGVGKARSYLEGYGSDAAGVAVSGTSVTISNPVVGETNYVEVTATGFTGRTASSELGVPVPAHPAVISIQ